MRQTLFTLVLLWTFFLNIGNCQAQEPVYQWSWKSNAYIIGASAGVYVGGVYLLNNADKITSQDLEGLEVNRLLPFDRGAVWNSSTNADKFSDYILFGSAIAPFALYLDKKCSKQGVIVGLMGVETFLINGALSNTAKGLTKRFRPYTYNVAIPLETRLNDEARFSFVSGHVSATASFSFFTAKVFSDLHPNSKWKPYVWAGAATLPAVVGYLRFEAGRHFPTDIIGGYLIGAATGYLVPHFHKNKKEEGLSFDLAPVNNGMLLSAAYRW
ncbi:phosphatase PAP2 family protein [Chitinophagales bacterium]|nr:phosphatase PAP2 family protein [Chitinophagales bacterium]